MKHLLSTLQSLQNEAIQIVGTVADSDYQQQFHPDLSPIGWHLGHCVYTETYWIQERLLGKQIVTDELKSIYVPELSIKRTRGTALPDKQALLSWAEQTQTENTTLLTSALEQQASHQLLDNNYLLHFLIQHYSQHIETMMMVLTELQRQQTNLKTFNSVALSAKQHKQDYISIKPGSCTIGATTNNDFHYDNEQPTHTTVLNDFNIATTPVSNGEFLAFMDSGAYTKKQFWSEAAWTWLNETQHRYPHHWQQDNAGHWFGIDHEGSFALNEDDTVYGISYFEAVAFAKWANARLPHEYEWETAHKQNSLQKFGDVWEWCDNTFHPYTGFSSYPYSGYSAPYFDDNHYVLKGGSRYTKMHIKRPSFRNYYTADKRHIFAGLRLVYD